MAGEDFDVIVAGAGPAGSACAYTLARAGRSVLLLERGDRPGAKNVSGGRLYAYALDLVDPGLRARAPLERRIVREQVMLLQDRRATTLDHGDFGAGSPAKASYSVIRATLDDWFAAEVEAQGGTLACGMRVDRLLEEDGRIVGVQVGGDEMRCGTVVAADGVNACLARQAGLFPDFPARAVGLGVKETIALPEAVINERFGVRGGEGAARVALGCTDGIAGGGFIYTNAASVSLGLVLDPEQAARHGRPVQDIFQDFKLHPALAGLLEGGTSLEFAAHLVPEGGYRGLPRSLHRPGLLVVGDAGRFGINTGLLIRGMDLALVSGLAAARAILEAPLAPGAPYLAHLEALGLLPAMRTYRNCHGLFELPRLFGTYPALANEALAALFTVDGQVPPPMLRQVWGVARSRVGLGQMASDAWKGVRAL